MKYIEAFCIQANLIERMPRGTSKVMHDKQARGKVQNRVHIWSLTHFRFMHNLTGKRVVDPCFDAHAN